MAQAPLAAEARVRSQTNPCGIYDGKVALWDRFLFEYFVFSLLSRDYHYTSSVYSLFIRLPQKLHNLSNWQDP
jgi:hypothetical protein